MAGGVRMTSRALRRALVSAGHDVRVSGLDQESFEACADVPKDMLVVDTDGQSPEAVRWALEHFRRSSPCSPVLFISRRLGDKNLVEWLRASDLDNLVGKHGGLTASEDFIDETEVMATAHKLLEKDIFGLEKYLPQYAHIHEVTIDHSRGRFDALDALRGFLDEIDCYRTVQPMIVTVADELLTNAIFNAPVDSSGTPKYRNLDRRDSFALPDDERVTFRYACDGQSVVLSVNDQFGTLTRETVVSALGRGLLGERADVAMIGSGANVGLYMLAHSITQLIFNVKSGSRTEVIGSFYVRKGLRGFRVAGQSLNLFFVD